MRTCANAAAYTVRVSICLLSPDLGRFWGEGRIYIGAFVEHPPPCEQPSVDVQLMMNGGPFCILIQGGLLMDRCHPATRQMAKIRSLGIELPMVIAI